MAKDCRLTVAPLQACDAIQRVSGTTHIAEHTSHNLLSSWPIVSSLDDLHRECSASNMIPADAFVQLGHYTDTLVPTYANKGGVSISMTKQLDINQRILS